MIKIEKPMLNREVEGRCGLDDPAQLAERIGRLQSLYMTALNNYVEGLRAAFGDVPNFNWNSFECCHCRSDGTTWLSDYYRNWRFGEYLCAAGELIEAIRPPSRYIEGRRRSRGGLDVDGVTLHEAPVGGRAASVKSYALDLKSAV